VKHHPRRRFSSFVLAIVAVLALSGADRALADAHLSSQLVSQLASALPLQKLQIVVVYKQSEPVRTTQIQALQALGITRGISFRALPIVGALATPGAIRQLAQRSDVLSISTNKTLTYYNHGARALSGVDALQADPAYGFTGAGVAVMINDSGIDALHGDLTYGSRVEENVQALTNLSSILTFLPVTYLEGQPNTDISSGHGTHCAGTVGGTGAQSGGQHRGVATDAVLIGYGSGAVISILDAVGGFDYAIANKDSFSAPIKVISNSWGTTGAFDPLDPVNIASYEAYKQGIVSVFAAGNEGPAANTINPYSIAPWVISVGAADKSGALADFSSRGNPGETGTFTTADGQSWTYTSQPTVVATGVSIVSTRALTGILPLLGAPDDINLDPLHIPFYTHMSGTSMATPHVAGIVALLFDANASLTPADVKQILVDTANPMPGRTAFEVGAGHVDAYEAGQTAIGY
jgi:serine protease AprX